jgi:hypothetical protein
MFAKIIDQMDELSSGYVARHKPTGMNVVMKLTNLAASTTYDLWQEAQVHFKIS